MFNKKYLFFGLLILFSIQISAQNCQLTIKGEVSDEESGLPLSFVNITIQELSKGTITNEDGSFELKNICEGEYHMIFSHIGCAPIERHVHFHRDTTLFISLDHTPISIGNVTIKGEKQETNIPSSSINRQTIENNTNESLANMLATQTGVSTLKNGNGIAKPVVHGLYGNRLTIINNGIIQGGQQWGNDHSPEIDPLSADKITVLKGANAIEYGGGNLGGVVLIEPKKISDDPHLHGQVNYAYESNGHGNNLNVRLEKSSPIIAWRINGTFKKYGDRKAPNYFLNNTGSQEINFSTQLEKSWKEKWFLDIYASTFNTNLGVLRGAHIGNLTDLEEALTREIPFFTEENFSYKIDAPKQKVRHHLIKLQAKNQIDSSQYLQYTLAGQQNNRKEFDIRRNGRSETPALSLNQYTLNGNIKYQKILKNQWRINLGNQTTFIDNTNNPETGILPLIPDYTSWKNGTFSTLSKESSTWHFNVGIRYDYELQKVVAISKTTPREIVRYNNQFHNIGNIIGIKYKLPKYHTLALHTGFSMRNPAINELYSNGLHQGVSGIEEGDEYLNTEKSLKTTIEYKWTIPSTKFSFNALAYHQQFWDYIYLNPQEDIRLTIRGAFPVYKYEQTDAHLYGLDLASQFTIGKSIYGTLKYSFLRGNDSKNKNPLVFMPPNRLYGSIAYRTSQSIQLSSKVKIDQIEIELNNQLTLKQKHLNANQDFLSPPPAYSVVGVQLSSNFIFTKYKLRVYTKIDNLLNTKYRDYLNRQRYFADESGISVTVGTTFKF